MNVNGRPMRTIWPAEDGASVEIIDQTLLPHELVIVPPAKPRRRGAGDPRHAGARRAADRRGRRLWHGAGGRRRPVGRRRSTQAVDHPRRDPADRGQSRLGARRHARALAAVPPARRRAAALERAAAIADEDVAINRAIGEHGAAADRARRQKARIGAVEILTHCNAGWLATVDWGTALAPIYRAHDGGIPLHVWVDETRPRNQGASLTAWELGQHGVPHTVIADNAGGHLMRHGRVDLCIVGTDRTTAGGDVANKIGTYLKALAAHDNGVPFYVALPSPTIDWDVDDGAAIPIEAARRARGHPHRRLDRSRRARRGAPDAGGQPGREFRLRRDPGAARHRADHRARRLPRLARRAARPLPGTKPRRDAVGAGRSGTAVNTCRRCLILHREHVVVELLLFDAEPLVFVAEEFLPGFVDRLELFVLESGLGVEFLGCLIAGVEDFL